MDNESTTNEQNTTLKHRKSHRSQSIISRKIVAFEELHNLKNKKTSSREIAKLLEIPKSTMHSWIKQSSNERAFEELENFFQTPVGADFLQRIVLSIMKLMKCGPSGIHGVQEFLRNTKIDNFVASSNGALQNLWKRCETSIIEFGDREEEVLSKRMKCKKITVGLDEMFRGRRPCLVAIEAVSNYIILEKFTEDRTASTWEKELEPRLEDLNIKVSQVVSDLCGAIRSFTKNLGAQHISELFHAVHEISKATSASLSSQERSVIKALNIADSKLKKLIKKSCKLGEKDRKILDVEKEVAVKRRNYLKTELKEKSERREKVKDAIKEMGKIHHPICLKSGDLQTAENMDQQFSKQFEVIKGCMEEANLSEKNMNRIEKARRAFDAIMLFVVYFFEVYKSFVSDLKLNIKQEVFFNTVVFPFCYYKMILKRLPKDVKKNVKDLMVVLEAKIQDGPFPQKLKEELLIKGRELAEMYQRSSSFVEGRNGYLSLNYHRFHGLSERFLKVLGIVHNFDTRRADGTTPAERLFEAKHSDLFEYLVANVRIPGRPQKQHHDPERRETGWEKRREKELVA